MEPLIDSIDSSGRIYAGGGVWLSPHPKIQDFDWTEYYKKQAEYEAKQRAEQWKREAFAQREQQRRAEEQRKAQITATRDALFSHLGELLNKLYTDEGRAHVVSGLVDKNRDVPKEYLDKSLIHYEKKEDMQSLAHLAQKAGVLGDLLNRYDTAGKYETGAAVADAAGLEHRATQFRNKIPTDRKTVMFDWLQAHQEGAAPDETIAALVNVGRIADAADVAHHAGLLQEEIVLRESAGQFAEAAQLQEQLLWPEKQQRSFIHRKSKERELAEKIVENYLKDRWIDDAAHVAKKVGDKEWEIRIYENAQWYDHALRVAGNKRERKLLIYERAGKFVDARNFSKQSRLKRDAIMYHNIATLLETEEALDDAHGVSIPEKTYCQEKPGRGIFGALVDTLLYFPRRITVDLISDYIKQHVKGIGVLAFGTITVGVPSIYNVIEQENAIVSSCPDEITQEASFCRVSESHSAIRAAEDKYRIPHGLLAGLAMVESFGYVYILNSDNDGSAGMFQLEPWVAKKYGMDIYDAKYAKTNRNYGRRLENFYKSETVESLPHHDQRFDPVISADVAGHYLRDLYHTKRNWNATIGAYKVGAKHASSYRSHHGKYIDAVLEAQRYYNNNSS